MLYIKNLTKTYGEKQPNLFDSKVETDYEKAQED